MYIRTTKNDERRSIVDGDVMTEAGNGETYRPELEVERVQRTNGDDRSVAGN